ncbi:MAG TPA: glycosyltransferase [Verrucomicrobiae bacterium]|jgi:chlorobactene glucosyltransferase|nr:glycosyltransferase [Verrucomicrobiae bacterium]
MAIAMLWAGVVATLLFRAVTQYRHYEILRRMEPRRLPSPALVTVIVPARNEARNIARCAQRLMAQDYPKLEMLVVNDNSTDHTATIVSDLSCFDARLRLVESEALPSGWAGKPHACWQGAQAGAGEWLCFMDADTMAEPGLITTAVRAAEERQLDMLSLEPFQELGGFWERLIIPAGFLLLVFQQDLRRVNNPDCPDAVANGQFILIRRRVYDAVGGHAAAPAEICEDAALARRVKGEGYKLAVLGASDLVCSRMYNNLESLWEGLSKNVVEMLGGTRGALLAAAAAFSLAWVTALLPFWAWHQGDALAASLISTASLALIATHVFSARYFGIPFFYGLLFPFGYTMGGLIALNSIRLRWKKRIAWKGRIYAPPAAITTAP